MPEESAFPFSREAFFGRLPAYYRERPGILWPMCEALADRFRELKELLERPASGAPESGRAGLRRALELLSANRPPALALERARSGSGTRGDLLRLVAAWRCAPGWIFSGAEALPLGERWIEIRSARQPNALLVWTRDSEDIPVNPDALSGIFPAMLRVQAAIVRRMPSGRRVLPGEVIQGSLIWTLGPAGTEPSSRAPISPAKAASGRS